MKALRPLRIAISFAVTFSLILIFTDFYRIIPARFSGALLFPQFIPSLLSFSVKASIAGTGFIIVILLTFISGRIYCSFICPLGFSQDIFIRAGNRIRREHTKEYSEPHYIIFYSLLSVSILSFAISGTILILWIDPFSIFGRFITYAASYPLIEINNSLASLLIKKNIFSVHTIDVRPSGAGIIFSLSIFSIIMLLSMFKGRLYCNTICPAGAVLSILSRISIFRIRINKESCIRCGKCENLCKSSCIDSRNGHVDTARCVTCFNCISRCPNGSISLSRRSPDFYDSTEEMADKPGTISRLSFISGILLLPQILSSKEKDGEVLYYQEPIKQKKYRRKSFSSPPGSVAIEKFNNRCTACSLCISTCPTSVLQPAVMQYGLRGIMQPFMDFNSGFCNYDCTVCGDICPTDAIMKKSLDAKRQVQTGKSVFIIENCITYTNGTDCGACSEHCPTKAVHMVPYKNSLVIPEVNTGICTGCGACEYACPVRPLKAIYVDGSRIHGTAKLPEIRKKDELRDSEFPF